MDSTKLTAYQMVKQFTEESTGKKLPTSSEEMTLEEIRFISSMVMSELAELFSTLLPDKIKIKDEMKLCLEKALTDLREIKLGENSDQRKADQLDALIDVDYYIKNAAAKKGWPYDEAFDEVHQANMNKRFADGKFHRREDGKIIKPAGWKERDLVSIIKNEKKDF